MGITGYSGFLVFLASQIAVRACGTVLLFLKNCNVTSDGSSTPCGAEWLYPVFGLWWQTFKVFSITVRRHHLMRASCVHVCYAYVPYICNYLTNVHHTCRVRVSQCRATMFLAGIGSQTELLTFVLLWTLSNNLVYLF